MKVELRHLRYFVALAEELNFSRAAERVYLSQPALSQQIKRLEEALGIRLLERNKRKVALTEPGRAFLRVARRTLSTFERGMEDVQRVAGLEVERLRIGLTDYANYTQVPEILSRFREAYPQIEVIEQEMGTLAQLEALREGALDVGIFMATARDPSLVFETLLVKALSLAMPQTHPLGSFILVPFTKLADERLLMNARRLSPGYYDLIDNCCKVAGIALTLVVNNGPRINSFSTAARMITAGEGLMVMMDWFAAAGHPDLMFRPLIEPTPKLEFVVAYRPDETYVAVHRLVELLKESVGTVQ